MAIDVRCPDCGEEENLLGTRSADSISIVEKSRGTQLSVVGTRPVLLCSLCDAEELRHYHAHRPNPLMPKNLPTTGEEHLTG